MGRELTKTPLYSEHQALGARMGPFAGYEMPIQFSGVTEEHRAVRTSAGIFDVCHMTQFRVFGFGSFDFLQGVLTNDLARISELGAAQYTLICDEDGGIIDDLIVYHTGDFEYLLIGNAANRTTDLDWLRTRLLDGAGGESGEQSPAPERGLIELADETDRTGLIAVQGPLALSVISELADDGFSAPGRFRISEARLAGVPVLVARTGYTGEDGVEIVCHASHAPLLWRALLSFDEVIPCGLAARDSLRLEMGYHLYGSDMDRGVDPVSAGLGWVVPEKGVPFTGSEAIARIRSSGPSRRLVGLVVEDGIPRAGHPVLHEGSEVGKVASGTFSPSLRTGIATAYLPVSLTEPGTGVSVAIRRKVVSARVERTPFVKATSLS
ncbi:MAG TPA: glycine cleavage system aminomethyltransferase GcvT [Coriobacteriia bacterium]|nr:glycine cleavage system aminomethyltransferase GcvT [Coriobacteriia bacterium]